MLTVQHKVDGELLKALFLERHFVGDHDCDYLRTDVMNSFVKELGIKRFEVRHEVDKPIESSVRFFHEESQMTVVMHPGDYLLFHKDDTLQVMTEDCFDAHYTRVPYLAF